MKNYKLVYNESGKLQDQIEEDEFYVAQQENRAVAFTATFPAFLVGTVRAYLQFKGGGDVVDCGNVNLNNNSVTVELDAKYLAYSFLKIGFEVLTATKEIRFEPVAITVDGFVNVSGNSSAQGHTVTVKIGTVTALEPGTEPYVTNSGTDKDAVLNFGIPRGDKPILGEDYWTEDDKQEIVQDVQDAMQPQFDTLGTRVSDLETGEADLEAANEELLGKVENKLDKDTIVTEAANNTLLLEENQDARLGETSSLVLSMPESIGDWYRSTFSFQSGESATSLVYGYTPLDWKGDDVTSDGRFVPEPFSTYEVDVKNLGINGIRARVDKIAGYSSVDVEGTVLSLPSSAGKALRDYKIYGNSEQDGTPSTETSVVIQSVGDYNEETRKYDVPIVVSGKNLLNPETLELGKTFEWGAGYDSALRFKTDPAYMTTIEIPVKPNCAYTVINELTDTYWCNRMVEMNASGNGIVNHAFYANIETSNYRCFSITTHAETVSIIIRYCRVDGAALTQADVDGMRAMLVEGRYTTATMPSYEPYRDPVTTTISLDEPLRKVGDVTDYIDYTQDAVMRQVEVLDDTGTLPLEESYAAAESPSMERIYWSDGRRFLPVIDTNLYDNVISIGTSVQPSNVKVTYFKKG